MSVSVEMINAKMKEDGNLPASIKAALKDCPLLIVAKSTCPYCIEASRFLRAMGVSFETINVDTAPDGAVLLEALKQATGQKTVPYIFIGGKLIGGCNDLKALSSSSRLEPMLSAAGVALTSSSKKRILDSLAVLDPIHNQAVQTFFAFPEMADDRAVRFTACLATIVSILVGVYFRTDAAHYLMLGLLVDFCCRFVAGGNFSPLGALANVCVALMDAYGSKPIWMGGLQVQFATFCGILFSAFATLFYLLEKYNSNLNWVGLAFTIMLAGATFLNGFVGWCAGCWMFGLGVKFGLIPESVYKISTSIRSEIQATWEYGNTDLDLEEPKIKTKPLVPGIKTKVDYVYKDKLEDYAQQDVNIVKHVKITHFLALMGAAGIAVAWKFASSSSQFMNAPQSPYWCIALGTAACQLAWMILYATKCYIYPQKVSKEWQCTLRGNSFVVPFVNFVLFAYLIDDYNIVASRVFFWIGAPASMLISLFKISSWIAASRDIEHVNAAWMISPVSAFVAAAIGPLLDNHYVPAMQFWFGFAFLMWLLLFSLTFHKAVLFAPQDDRLRPLLAIWIAAPAVMAIAYVNCFAGGSDLSSDFIFLNLFWFSISLSCIFLVTLLRPFFGRMRFDMSYWAAGFPSAALSLVSTQYASSVPGNVSAGIAYAALAAASAINTTLALHTLAALIRGRVVFVPDYKWGPLSYMRLSHEAFRNAFKSLVTKVGLLTADSDPVIISDIIDLWRGLRQCIEMHARHEDEVIFKAYCDFFPEVSKEQSEEHRHHEAVLSSITDTLANIANSSTIAPEMLTAACDLVSEFVRDQEQHMLSEEMNLVAMPRKHVNLSLHKKILAECWDLETAETWREMLPFILNSLPMLPQRVRFIKALIWALPDRTQQIGLMVAVGVDDVQWTRITAELPEIIPRGADGFERYY